jgi:CRP-like cAMP-binding protein
VAKALPTLSFDQLLAASHKFKPREYEAGAVIISEGKNLNNFYIVAKGSVEVILPRQNQSDVVTVELGPGKYFGEMEFFHDHRSRASIRACQNCAVQVLELSYDQLQDLLSQSEVTLQALRRAADAHEQENIRGRTAKS